jgi:hypothetical protein
MGDVPWIDVDTPAALARAEAMLAAFGPSRGRTVPRLDSMAS